MQTHLERCKCGKITADSISQSHLKTMNCYTNFVASIRMSEMLHLSPARHSERSMVLITHLPVDTEGSYRIKITHKHSVYMVYRPRNSLFMHVGANLLLISLRHLKELDLYGKCWISSHLEMSEEPTS